MRYLNIFSENPVLLDGFLKYMKFDLSNNELKVKADIELYFSKQGQMLRER